MATLVGFRLGIKRLLAAREKSRAEVMERRAVAPAPLMVRRTFLLLPDLIPHFSALFAESLVRTEKEWSETYYDTEALGLSGAECSVMKESTAPGYWKLASHSADSPMEVTTDERELGEPLGRLLTSPSEKLDTNLLRPFFSLKALTRSYLIKGCQVRVTMTDYGFATATIEHYCLQPTALASVIDEVSAVAKLLGFSALSLEQDPA